MTNKEQFEKNKKAVIAYNRAKGNFDDMVDVEVKRYLSLSQEEIDEINNILNKGNEKKSTIKADKKERTGKDRLSSKAVNSTKKIRATLRELLTHKKINLDDIIICKSFENITFDTRNETINFLSEQDLFVQDIEQCIFFEENVAWVSQDKNNNKFYYFSKNEERNEYFRLDLVGLVEIVLNISRYKARKYLIDRFNVNVTLKNDKGEEWLDMKQIKYEISTEYLERYMQLGGGYKFLDKLIGKHLMVLQKLNNIAIAHLSTFEYSYKDHAMFYVSNDYLAKMFEVGKTTINRIINMFCLLGIIEKVPVECIPIALKNKVVTDKKQHDMTFYIINDIHKQTMFDYNEKAIAIISAGISIRNISEKAIREAFGDKEADKVYGNTKDLQKVINQIKVNKKAQKASEELIAPMDEDEELPF